MKLKAICLLTIAALCHLEALAQFDSGSDGSDGAFNPQADVEIDLGLATTASWDTFSPNPGDGVYDPELWAVVFKYTTIDIPGGVTVTFKNHPSGAPVVWLASGDVAIVGAVMVNGKNGENSGELPAYAEPGPGGFAGGIRGFPGSPDLSSSGGFGPGGAPRSDTLYAGGGGYGFPGLEGAGPVPGGPVYGNEPVIPLIGGSGGGGGESPPTGNGDAGAGGGAILIASSGAIALEGAIDAIGGYGGVPQGSAGSGGAIRLIADSISGAGTLVARGGNATGQSGMGGKGRIRVEAYDVNLVDGGDPNWTMDLQPGPVFPPAGSPLLRATFVDGQPVPADPDAGVRTPDLSITNSAPVTINIEAENVPPGTTVEVRIVPEHGDEIVVDSSPLEDVGGGLLTATATVTFPPFRSEMQLRANWTP